MDVEEAEYNIQIETTGNRRTVWQAKYIEVDTPTFISKWTKSGILLYSRMKLVKSKANPVQAWIGPEGFQEDEAPIFIGSRHIKVARLSALRTGRKQRVLWKNLEARIP